MWRLLLLVLLALWIAPSRQEQFPDVVDLTHRLKMGETLTWPGYPYIFNKSVVFNDNETMNYGIWVEAHEFSMVIHVGTHMDAPCHMCKGCRRMHEVPFEDLRAEAVVMDLSAKAREDINYLMTIQDIQDWEAIHGPVPKKAFIMIFFGGEDRWGDMASFWGTDDLDDHSSYNFPGVGPETVHYMVDVLDVKGVGADWGVLDNGDSLNRATSFENHGYVHRTLLSNNRLIFEYVANLRSLPPTGYTVFANPLKIHDSCGAPLRMIAIKNPSSAAWACQPLIMLVAMVTVLAMMLQRS